MRSLFFKIFLWFWLANIVVAGAAVVAVLVMIGIAATLVRMGLSMLRPATLVPIVIAVAALLKLASPVIDATQSSRPVAQVIRNFSHEDAPVAKQDRRRQR